MRVRSEGDCAGLFTCPAPPVSRCASVSPASGVASFHPSTVILPSSMSSGVSIIVEMLDEVMAAPLSLECTVITRRSSSSPADTPFRLTLPPSVRSNSPVLKKSRKPRHSRFPLPSVYGRYGLALDAESFADDHP